MIQKAKNNEMVTEKKLENLLGKLNHSNYILREGCYFLSCLRDRLKWANKAKRKHTHIGKKDVKDLELWKKFLAKLEEDGRSTNHITLTYPNCLCKSDACYKGMGGFTSEGVAWRFWIPAKFQYRVSIDILEFIAV